MAIEITVVGSINQDVVARVPRHPAPGETVLAHSHFTAAGGKGANQAVAAARLGRTVAMIGRVGADPTGSDLVDGLQAEGIDTSRVRVTAEAPTGLALITLDEAGENSIVVSPGANHAVTVADVAAAGPLITEAPVVVLQLEVPMAAVTAAAGRAGGMVILNPAPAAGLSPELLAAVDVLVPNETELGRLAGAPPPTDPDAAVAMARSLSGPGAVVLTMGAAGAVVVTADGAHHLPAPTVDVVDTTAAGDAFCGGLAAALVRGADLVEAAGWAVRVGAAAVTRLGAQPSLPNPAEVPTA